nr:hypothetical protein [Brevibacterium sp. VCM10]
MDYENVFFPSLDGMTLESWFIPAAGSDKLLIVNHPVTCNRYGFPGHLTPWNTMAGGFEVNFLPEYRALHDAGYNILAYDLRNHGRSASDPAGTSGLGLVESRYVVGSVRHAKRHWPEMSIGLCSRCMGGNSTIMAMDLYPEDCAETKVLAVVNVVSRRAFIEKAAEAARQNPAKAAERLDTRIRKLTGFHLDEQTPLHHAHTATVPTLMAQLRRDFLIHAEKDGQEIFDALGSDTKELFWIEESNQRFYAYNYFGDHPAKAHLMVRHPDGVNPARNWHNTTTSHDTTRIAQCHGMYYSLEPHQASAPLSSRPMRQRVGTSQPPCGILTELRRASPLWTMCRCSAWTSPTQTLSAKPSLRRRRGTGRSMSSSTSRAWSSRELSKKSASMTGGDSSRPMSSDWSL